MLNQEEINDRTGSLTISIRSTEWRSTNNRQQHSNNPQAERVASASSSSRRGDPRPGLSTKSPFQWNKFNVKSFKLFDTPAIPNDRRVGSGASADLAITLDDSVPNKIPVLISDEGEDDDAPLLRIWRETQFTVSSHKSGRISAPGLTKRRRISPEGRTRAAPRPIPRTPKKRPPMSLAELREVQPPLQPLFLNDRYTFGDAFCGGGGTSCGAKMAGFRIRWGVDRDKSAIQTYSANYPEAASWQFDINDFLTANLSTLVDVVHISPPCQPFSPAHTIAGRHDEANQAAGLCISDILNKCRPRMATLEQTPGLLHHELYFRRLLGQFTDRGFSVAFKVLRGVEFGLPQNRKRLFIMAARQAYPTHPVSHFPQKESQLTSLSAQENPFLPGQFLPTPLMIPPPRASSRQ